MSLYRIVKWRYTYRSTFKKTTQFYFSRRAKIKNLYGNEKTNSDWCKQCVFNVPIYFQFKKLKIELFRHKLFYQKFTDIRCGSTGEENGNFFPNNKVFNTKNNVKDDLYDKCKKCVPISSPKSSCWIHAWSSWCISEIYVFVLMLFAF